MTDFFRYEKIEHSKGGYVQARYRVFVRDSEVLVGEVFKLRRPCSRTGKHGSTYWSTRPISGQHGSRRKAADTLYRKHSFLAL